MSEPRRADITNQTPAEHAIRSAASAVDALGTDSLLSEALVLLDQARNKVADYVDRPKSGGHRT